MSALTSARPGSGSPLHRPRFRRLWLGGFVSDVGDWLLLVAMPVFVFETTGSAGNTAITFLCGLLPGVLLAPVGGALADRHSRAQLMATLLPLQAVTLLPLLLVHGRSGLGIVYAVVAVQSTLEAGVEPAKQAQVPDLVDPGDLLAANSLMSLTQNLGRLVGGPLGGLLIAGHELSVVVLADATTFLVAAVLVATTASTPGARPAPAMAAPEPVGRRTLPADRRGPIVAVLVVTVAGQIAQGLFLVLFVVFVGQDLHGDGSLTGLLRGVQAIGAIAAGVAVGLGRRTPRSPGRAVGVALILFAAISAAIWNAPALTTHPAFYVVGFILVGAPGVVAGAGLTAILQSVAPAAQLGRWFGINAALANLGVVVGIVLAGTAGRIELHTLLDLQAGIYLAAGLIALLVLGRRGTGWQRGQK